MSQHARIRRISAHEKQQFVKLQQGFRVPELMALEGDQACGNDLRVAFTKAPLGFVEAIEETLDSFCRQEVSALVQ